MMKSVTARSTYSSAAYAITNAACQTDESFIYWKASGKMEIQSAKQAPQQGNRFVNRIGPRPLRFRWLWLDRCILDLLRIKHKNSRPCLAIENPFDDELGDRLLHRDKGNTEAIGQITNPWKTSIGRELTARQ